MNTQLHTALIEGLAMVKGSLLTRLLVLTPEASFSTCLQEILKLEGYEMIEATDSCEGFQATTWPSYIPSQWMRSISPSG